MDGEGAVTGKARLRAFCFHYTLGSEAVYASVGRADVSVRSVTAYSRLFVPLWFRLVCVIHIQKRGCMCVLVYTLFSCLVENFEYYTNFAGCFISLKPHRLF